MAGKNVLLVGGTGFLGQQIGIALARQGYNIFVTGRKTAKLAGQMSFPCRLYDFDDQNTDQLSEIFQNHFDIVMNLAGAPIAGKRWTKSYRKTLQDSRVQLTKTLTDAILQAPHKPQIYLQSSAVGYYGDREDEILSEGSEVAQDFLGQLCFEWEHASLPLEKVGIRRVLLRNGIILGLTGGALPKLMGLYLKRLGAVLGSGRQWMSWIHIADAVSMHMAAIEHEAYQGAINCVAPNPVRFRTFHNKLNEAIGLANHGFAPSPVVKGLMGKASAIVLSSQRCLPTKSAEHGFGFQFPTLEKALENLISSAPRRGAQILVREQWIAKKPDQIWDFFSDETNLEKLTPKRLSFKILNKSTQVMQQGTLINYRIRVRGLPMHWRTLISQWQPPIQFTDIQLKGPYKSWHHVHKLEELAGGTLMTDQVTYVLPLRIISNLSIGLFIDKDVESIFDFRRKTIAELFNKH